jgi:DNA-binding MarR family transcriptional regulator
VTDATRFFEDLVRAQTRLYNAVDDRMLAEHGLGVGQFELLAIIDRRPDCRVLDIVNEVNITVGAASKAVDRLERAGWCVRTVNPDDRRSSLLRLTPAGARVLATARPTFEEQIETLLRGVAPAGDLRRTATTLAALRAALERYQRDGGAGQRR